MRHNRAIAYIGLFAALSLAYLLLRGSSWQGSTQLHTLMETIATFLALFVGVMALVRFYSKKTNLFLFIGTGFLGTGLLDGYHSVVTSTLFADHFPSPPPSLIPWSWIASRVFLSILLWLSYLAWKREARMGERGRIREKTIYITTGVLTLGSFLFFAFVPLPRAYYPELIFHRPEEFVPALFFLLALIGYLRKGHWKQDVFEHWLVLSLIVGFMGQAMFMSFSGRLFDTMFDAAHLLKKVSYVFVLTGLMISMYRLFKQAEESEKEILWANEALQEEIVERRRTEAEVKALNETLEQRVAERTKELESSRTSALNMMEDAEAARKEAEQSREALRKAHGELEQRVEERTAELSEANAQLKEEIGERQRAEAELRVAKEAAEEASRAKSQFLAKMSHELRTPLNAIIGYSEMLQEEAEDLDLKDFVPDLRKIHGAGRHLLGLINDILDLSKIEAGRMEVFTETFVVSNLVRDVMTTIQPLVKQNDNRLEFYTAEDLSEMRSDATKVRQVLFNLLSNACKFTEKGTVSLNASREAAEGRDWIVFRVDDTGIGMTSKQMTRLFQPFSQADASTTRKYGGTGLGLAIVQNFCQVLGGSVKVESRKGVGTTFTVRLPTVAEGAALEEPAGPAEGPGAASPATSGLPVDNKNVILAIDDDPAALDLVGRTLSQEGFRVVTASSGEEGLKLAGQVCPAAITLDVMMPGMDGWAVLTELKADPDLAEIPVVMLTIVDNRNLGFALGASDYLTKPIERDRLVAILKKYGCDDPPCTVLVVEDAADTREMMRRVLEKEGWVVTEAGNGRAGLESVTQNRPHLIFLDLMMPEMDGFEFIAEMRNVEDWRSIPIVVLTAKDLTEEDRSRLNGYVETILQKGMYSREDLLDEIRKLVAACARPAGA